MDERKFGRILETGMGLIMSGVLNFSAMKILGAPVTFMSVMIGWVGAFAAAVAINYFFPVMDWCIGWTKGITNKTAEYIVRVFIFAFIEILFNCTWCLAMNGLIRQWPVVFPRVELIGIPVIFICLPVMMRVAAALAGTK